MGPLPLKHLLRLTDRIGVIEHARYRDPAREHGYCVDDAARALIIVAREPDSRGSVDVLVDHYLSFVITSMTADGRCRNRRAPDGRWVSDPDVDDAWGRAIWALGVAATRSRVPAVRERALVRAIVALNRRSPHVRSTAFATLGAAEILASYPSFDSARRFVMDALAVIPHEPRDEWRWPEERLRYANATVAEAVIAAGVVLERPDLLNRGLVMLTALAELETRDGHLSLVGTAGAGPDDVRPLFDQQPIEAAAIADAAVRAWEATADPQWLELLDRAWNWFLGVNDVGVAMFDAETGAGFDGLEPGGRNENCGAESTLAYLSTLQHSRRLRMRDVA